MTNDTEQTMPIERTNRNVVTVRLNGRAGSQWQFLLRSDVHHDNPKCDQELERRHLDEALARGAGIIDNGDLFCAMQGKFDKRSDKSALRPEHTSGDYLDRLVDTAAEFYAPYARNIIVLGLGNHETAIRKNHETDLTERLAEKLSTPEHRVLAGGYGTWVRFLITLRETVRLTRLLYCYHGTGGGGPVTRGVIQTSRLAVFCPDADFVLSGHTHDSWVMPIARQRMSASGKIVHDRQLHIRVGGYKDAWGDGHSGFEVEKMLGPKPIGAAWLTLTAAGDAVEDEVREAR